jgi:hypothetical protein
MARSASLDSQLCRVDGCGNKIDIKKHQLCSKHHQAFWKYGDPLGSPNKTQPVQCRAPGCERIGSGNAGLCHMHHLRDQRTGQFDLKVRERRTCSVEGCCGTAKAKGMCQGHYDKQRGSHRSTTRTCSEAGCSMPVKARGVCHNHYAQLQRHGKLHTAPRSRPTTVLTRPRPCRGCGADLAGLPRGHRYCSDACKPRCSGPDCDRKVSGRDLCSTHLKQRNGGIALRPVGERVIRATNQPCNWCGDPVGPNSAASYCSVVCRSLARRHTAAATAGNCAQCNSAIDYLAPANGTSRRLTPVSKRLCDKCCHRSASLYMSADALRLRDGDACALCGLPVPATARKPHPLAAEVDHVLPISRGGTHDPENLALTHKTCNIAKGGRPATWHRDPREVLSMLAEWNSGDDADPPTMCSVLHCGRRPDSHGMCQKHRRRVMKYGTAELPRGPTHCAVDDCGKPVRAKGRCRSHYREYLVGDKTCISSDCSRRVHTRQLCRRHYQEWLDSRASIIVTTTLNKLEAAAKAGA